jgi:asparagine synthase (glutamine-hydrolysing)
MHSVTGRFVIAYNGEVYNFQDIRSDLETKGWKFHTTSDTEVVLAAIEEWGVENAVRRFIGMFAIALWDNLEKKLVLIRDRLGVKPLYYGWDGKTLVFGSELKALRAFRHWQSEIDQSSLAEYFQFGYINAPRSIYKSVLKLQPGHWLELSQAGVPVIKRYWSVLDSLGSPLLGTEDELAEQLESLMVDAFSLRMVSDVPVGMFLSGGIDSSLVTALLQKHHGNIHTFTIGFNEPKYNEAAHARAVAEFLGTNHTERILETDEAKRVLPHWGDLYDEPFADSSGIPTYLVSKIASEQVKVVLSADGGDELFSGYNAYWSMLKLLETRDGRPAYFRLLLESALRVSPLDLADKLLVSLPLPTRLRDELRHRVVRRARWAKDFHLTAETPAQLYEKHASGYWRPKDLAPLLPGPIQRIRELADEYPGVFAEQMCLWDLHNYLPGDILTKVDRATMAMSIEGREPLIDHRIVEFAFRLPLAMRRGNLGPKHILRKILHKYVPRELVDRPKMGFGIPLMEWLRGDFAYLIDEYLHPAAIRDSAVIDCKTVERIVKAFRQGDGEVTNKLWSLLAFQMWHRRWS